MRSVAELAAKPFTADSPDADDQHIINHFNGHRVLKRLIYNDTERMKLAEDTGKSAVHFRQPSVLIWLLELNHCNKLFICSYSFLLCLCLLFF